MKFVFLSSIARGTLCHKFFLEKNYTIYFFDSDKRLYASIDTHPDILITDFHNLLIMDPLISKKIISEMEKKDKHISNFIISGKKQVREKYPGNIGYNAIVLGDTFIHNLKYTDPAVLGEVEKRKLHKINIKQGYSKCSILPVADDAIITSDKGIFKTLSSYGIKVLLIREGGIELKDKPYGFIGGASGSVEGDILFFGDVSKHHDFSRIKNFIEFNGKKVIYFDDLPLEDIGSIITFNVND